MKTMKKLLATLLSVGTLFAAALGFAACGSAGIDADPYTITVGASRTPHAEILNAIKKDLAAYGYTLKVEVFGDYITPNTALEEGDLDANYFQHTPYLNTFNKEHNTHLVSVAEIHYELFGVYGNSVTKEDYETNKTGRKILIPNDGSNLARALYLLEDEGFITLKSTEFNESLTTKDIADLNGNTVSPVDADTVANLLQGSAAGTLAIINGNYALQNGLKSERALAFEDAEGVAAQAYANIIAVKSGNETHPKIKALLTALRSKKVVDFIAMTYNGAVIPVFTVE